MATPYECTPVFLCFLCGSAGKESACNALDPVWLGKIPWRRDRLPTPVFLGFPGGSDDKESICSAGNLGFFLRLGRSPGEEHGNPLQYSCLENPHAQRSLAGYGPWCRKELDTTERPTTAIANSKTQFILNILIDHVRVLGR